MEDINDKSEFRNESVTIMLNEKEKASFVLFCIERLKMHISTGGRMIVKEFMKNWERWHNLDELLVITQDYLQDFKNLSDHWFNRFRYERYRRLELVKLLRQNKIEIPNELLTPYNNLVKKKKN